MSFLPDGASDPSSTGEEAPGPRLLDLVPGAVVAFGLRLLRSDFGRETAGKIIELHDHAAGRSENFDDLAVCPLSLPAIAQMLGGATSECVTWYDQSGRGNHAEAVAARPLFGLTGDDALPTLRFQPPAQLCSPVGLDGLDEFTIFAVFRGPTVADCRSVARWQGIGDCVVFPYHTGDAIISADGGVDIGGMPLGVTPARFAVYGLVWRRNAADGFTTYRDGQVVAQRVSADQRSEIGSEPLYIGSYAGLAEHFAGELRELIIWPRALSAEEIRLVSDDMRIAAGPRAAAAMTTAPSERLARIAYLIMVHEELGAVADLVSRVYDRDNFYCICVNGRVLADGFAELAGLAALPNVHVVAIPPTAWGVILENLLTCIEVCLRYDANWQSLIFLTGGHIPVALPSVIRDRIAREFAGKIVLAAGEHPIEFAADRDIVQRWFADPFVAEPPPRYDNAIYNPSPTNRLSLKRDGTGYYIRPDAMRAGWSRTSHFVTNLVRHNFVPEHDAVYVDMQPRLKRRLLEQYFKNRVMAAALGFGVFPRDFCEFCLNSPEALTYFSLIHDCFAAEESFLATLAHDPRFIDRLDRSVIVVNAGRPQAILTSEDVDEAVAGGRLFARKAPDGEPGREFRTAVYARLGIPPQLDIAQLSPPQPATYRDQLLEQFRRHIRFTGCQFAMGILGDRQLAAFTLLPDLALQYADEPPPMGQPAGIRWAWRDAGFDAFNAGGANCGRWDGFRVNAGRLFVLGYWPWAEPTTLACVADLGAMLGAPPSSPRLAATDGGGEVRLDEHLWHYWSSDRAVAGVSLRPDGTIAVAADPDVTAGYWRVDAGRLLAFGLDDMPIALFDRVRRADGSWHLAGVTWSRRFAIEPCSLVQAGEPPSS